MTQLQLATAAGIKQASLSELETGETKEISGPTLIALAKALRVRSEWLMTGELPTEAAQAEQLAAYTVSSVALNLARTYDSLPPDCQEHLRNQAALLKRVLSADGDRQRAAEHDVEIKGDRLQPRHSQKRKKNVT